MPTSLDEQWIIPPVLTPTPEEQRRRSLATFLLLAAAVITVLAVYIGFILGRSGPATAPVEDVDFTRALSVCATGVPGSDARFHLIGDGISVDTISDQYQFGELGCVLGQLGTSKGLVSQISFALDTQGVTSKTEKGLTYVWSVHPGVFGHNVLDLTINQEN